MRMRKIAVLGAALFCAAYAPHNSTAPARWALLIGIGDYQNFGAEIGGDLPGASWDARRMRDVLVARWGYDAARVKLVLDLDATRARIKSEITEWLPSVVKPGDQVLVFFAGHGSQTWDINGDEEDGLDETFCPTDVTKGNTDKDILDDELNEWLGKVPTNTVVFMDNCHAGSGTRAATPYARPRSLARNVSADVAKPANAARAGMTAETPTPRNVLEIAAAQSNEVAVDAEWPGANGAPATFGGAFTTTLVRNLWRAPRNSSYEDIYHMTVEDMKRQRFAQQPLLTKNGSESQSFGVADGEAASSDDAFVPVVSATAAGVQLGGGTGAGITVGSLYKVGNATLRVTDVTGDGATARVETGTAPARGSKAQLIAYAYPDNTLRVSLADVDAATRTAITAAMGASPSIRFMSSPRDFAQLIVRPSERGYVVIGMDGALRHTLTAADRNAGAKAVAAALQTELGAHQLSALDNPGQTQNLEFAFAGNRTSFKVNEEIAFRARSPRAGYLTIVDLGTDGNIVVLFPNEAGQNNRVAAGQLFELPAGGDRFKAQNPTGRGIVRAFITDRPLELPFREGKAEQAATILGALRKSAGNAPVATSTAIPTSSWLTSSIVYTIEN